MVDAPEKIWIEHDGYPYFYEESELDEVGSHMTEYVRADLYAALEAQLAASTGAVKVKPLEWEETHTRRSDEDPTTEWNGGFEADSAFGYYEISMGFGSDAYYWAVTNPLGDDVGSNFEDPLYAKAAAQADYERRILSALEATPPAPMVTEEKCDGQICYYHGCQNLPGCALTAAQEARKP